jgi:hypothetical protein
MNLRWWRRKSRNEPMDRSVNEIQAKSGSIFANWTDEEIEIFYRATGKETHKRHSELLAELAFYEWGTPQHREAAYRIHCLGVAIRNTHRTNGSTFAEYLVPREQFEKHYYGSADK